MLTNLPNILTFSRILAIPVLIGLFGAFSGGIDADRIAERRLGEYLGERLWGGKRVTGDLTRVLWFAGQRPLPPRHFDVAQLAAMAAPGKVRYFVFSERSKRESSRLIEAELRSTFGRYPLPEPLASLCEARGIVVLSRR